MKGQKTEISSVVIISSTELRYYGNQKTIKICSNKTILNLNRITMSYVSVRISKGSIKIKLFQPIFVSYFNGRIV